MRGLNWLIRGEGEGSTWLTGGEVRGFYQADMRRGEVLAGIQDERERVLPG